MGIIWAQNKINMPYDFPSIKDTSLKMVAFYGMRIGFWSIFVDGTFENYPSTFGPYIESNYFVDKIDSSSNDTIHYPILIGCEMIAYLDNLDIGLQYLKDSRKGFARF